MNNLGVLDDLAAALVAEMEALGPHAAVRIFLDEAGEMSVEPILAEDFYAQAVDSTDHTGGE